MTTLPDRDHLSAADRVRLDDRFTSKIDKQGACWLWTGGRTRAGYGAFCITGVERKTMHYAHRVAYWMFRGPIPPGLFVCHNCPGGDTKACVNPAHLWLGSQLDNMRDCIQKGRARYATRLTPEIVAAIRQRYQPGTTTLVEVGAEFGISFQHVSAIVHGVRWGRARA